MTSKAGHPVTTCKYFYKPSIYNPTYVLVLCDTPFITLHYTTLHYNAWYHKLCISYLDKIFSDHMQSRPMFVYILHIHKNS